MDVRGYGYNLDIDPDRMRTMDRHPARRPSPPVLELLEPPRGLGLAIPELEALIVAADDRSEYVGPDERALLRRGRALLERELGRLIATF